VVGESQPEPRQLLDHPSRGQVAGHRTDGRADVSGFADAVDVCEHLGERDLRERPAADAVAAAQLDGPPSLDLGLGRIADAPQAHRRFDGQRPLVEVRGPSALAADSLVERLLRSLQGAPTGALLVQA
jgi:hypothetical protein